MNRTRCPACGKPIRFDEELDDEEYAIFMHSLSGECRAKPKPPPIKVKEPRPDEIDPLMIHNDGTDDWDY